MMIEAKITDDFHKFVTDYNLISVTPMKSVPESNQEIYYGMYAVL
jgi:hypothetical protein